MNVNLTPSVDNSKVTNVTKSGTTSDSVTSDSGETKGFLDKLASLLLGGKSEGEVTDSEGKADAKLTSKGDAKATDAESLKSSSTDALLAQEEGSEDGESVDVEVKADTKVSSDGKENTTAKTVAKNPDSDQVEIPEKLKGFIASDEDEQVKLKAKTAQAMDDGDKILGRLQEANQTLVKKDGKPLPHEEADAESVSKVKAESQQYKATANGIATADPVQQPSQDDETLKVGTTAISEQPVKNATLPNEDIQDVVQGAVRVNHVVDEKTAELPDDHPLKQAKNAKDVQALSDSEVASILSKQPKVTVQQPDEVSSDELIAPVAAAAIPWASSTNVENTAVNNAEMDGKVSMKPAQHGAVVQQAHQHQALQTQQAATQAERAVAAQPVPAAVNSEAAAQTQLHQATNMHASPMLSSAMMAQADSSVNQAALKAGLGAKALAGLADSKQKGQTSDAHLAQQLSAAAGQQGVNGSQSLRAEGLQAPQTSSPLQLARSDMAADEVAERVQVMLSKNLKNIDIRLDPPELGRMHIRMNMNSDGATVHFTVANQQARDALEQSMPRLREMLNNQGVQLGDTSVQQQSSGQQQRYAASGDGSGGQSASGDHSNSDENLDTNVKLDLNVASKRDGISYYA